MNDRELSLLIVYVGLGLMVLGFWAYDFLTTRREMRHAHHKS